MYSTLWMGVLAVIAAYLLGSIPTGLVLVRLSTGKDLRQEHSGRTGGTNAARAAGAWAGVGTMIGDGLKAAGAVWLAHALSAGQPLIEAIAGIVAVVGHNYSLFMIERREGKLHFRGGAGGAPTVGAAIGLWGPSALFMIPTGIGVLLLIGYASVATISVGVAATVVFLVRAAQGSGPWGYVLFGPVVVVLLLLALRPNLARLRQGTERIVGLRAWWHRRTSSQPGGPGETTKPPST
ncbi:MAG: glycerol-3-phosphate acyltransferase [Chloroflexi bacterium]|nr:glycerol-3-phosphate acyltransferase [Chloroflexota bacterium]